MSLSDHAFYPDRLVAEVNSNHPFYGEGVRDRQRRFDLSLPARITAAASKQSYFTIRLLVDRERMIDAYRAYAYFRWVDDWLDQSPSAKSERSAFVKRQQTILDGCCNGERLGDLLDEERMLVDLIHENPTENAGLRAYLRHMMAVMAFDADRRGRLITQEELEAYTRHLAMGVTEALHYFIGHDDPSPQCEARYLAVTGAHIAHMLRDTFEDVGAGYFNVPREYLVRHGIEADDVECAPYRAWVQSRVKLARDCFAAGRTYLRQVKSLRCRLAGYAYTARFVGTLNAIERDNYYLRPAYPERKSLRSGLWMGFYATSIMFQSLLWGRS